MQKKIDFMTLKEKIQNLLDQIPPSRRKKGEDYFDSQRVRCEEYKPQTCALFAKVSDHQVRLQLVGEEFTRCSCYLKTTCSHIAASLYFVLSQQKEPTVSIDPELDSLMQYFGLKQLPPPLPSPPEVVSQFKKIFFVIVQTNPLLARIYLGHFFGSNPKPTKVSSSSLFEIYSDGFQKTDKVLEILSDFLKKDQLREKVLSFEFEGGHSTLQKIVSSCSCYFKDYQKDPLSWENSVEAYFDWEIAEDFKTQKLVCRSDKPVVLLTDLDVPCYLDPKSGTIGYLHFQGSLQKVQAILKMPFIEQKNVQQVHDMITSVEPSLIRNKPKEVNIKSVDRFSHARLEIQIEEKPRYFYHNYSDEEEVVSAYLSFVYEGYEVPYQNYFQNQAILKEEKEIVTVQRSHKAEKKAVKLLNELGWDFQGDFLSFEIEDLQNSITEFMLNQKEKLEKLGWEITISEEFPVQDIYETEEWYIHANESTTDWFDIELGTLIDGERVNMIPFLSKLVAENKKQGDGNILEFLESKETVSFIAEGGKLIVVSADKVKNVLEPLLVEFENEESLKKDASQLHLSKWSSAVLNEMEKAEGFVRARWIGSETLRSFVDKIKQMKQLPQIALPKKLKCNLRPYQLEGVSWLQFLRECDLNGILADDMGLGKTVQTLTHILIEKESGRMKSPTLIIAPTSLMSNWLNEAEKFTPSLKVLILQGADRHDSFKKILKQDIILTTYPLLIRDKENYLPHEFHLLIVDEAQIIKNARTQSYQILQQLRARHRLCLSGTPMQNHLGEIWSLFNFLLPGFLGNERKFHSLFRRPIEKENNHARQQALNQRLHPFMLRRTKQQVIVELPEKTEIIQKIDLNSEQTALYEAVRLKAQERVMRAIAQKGLERSQIAVLDALLKLRQVCCDPRLLKLTANKRIRSAKLDYVMEILPQMIEEKRKILLFSQFTSMLHLLEEEMQQLKIPYSLLTGSTVNRKEAVDAFQKGSVPIMLLSLKAGGVGLNLTSADTVIHYDPWWNPSAEDQATDRAHRMGQTKNVFVYKLIMKGTLEEKILLMQEKKKALVNALMNADDVKGLQFSMEDIEQIFKPLS